MTNHEKVSQRMTHRYHTDLGQRISSAGRTPTWLERVGPVLGHIRCSYSALAMLATMEHISVCHKVRLWIKCVCVYFCLVAFTDPEKPRKQLARVMLCAILTGVYDYETDWIRVADPDQSRTFEMLDRLIEDPDARRIGRDLFRRDWADALSPDGLDRGSPSFECYCLVIHSDRVRRYAPTDIDRYGRTLQIIDDLFDLDRDSRLGQRNCFLTSDPRQYIVEANEILSGTFVEGLARSSWVWVWIRKRCRSKLETLAAVNLSGMADGRQ
jgi:hypothetical protein